ncbi:hypothetical protein Pcinc_040310 [Petrolisthes cinctipes]|uniref:Uncharacterized protein n=1 Tax=Petrolisthes cinctipes TaxID=88211 RepID=A0AAE1BPV1_PETCI|nr:hypothetical protein Pcinc_040310 [Petrolisthes cinctipes]
MLQWFRCGSGSGVGVVQVWKCVRCGSGSGVEVVQVWKWFRCGSVSDVAVVQVWQWFRCGSGSDVEVVQWAVFGPWVSPLWFRADHVGQWSLKGQGGHGIGLDRRTRVTSH